ncbi:MAG TPA: hypothetical protein PKM88_15160, partial [bacterium]|nr:hypothetical protein [bacterium]
LAAQAVDYLLSSEPKHEFQIVTVTMADEQGAAHSTPGGAAELISALQQREIDLAVLPGEAVPPALPDGVSVAAVADRVTPHDVLVTRAGMALADLPAGAAAGAADRARAVRVRALRRDLMPVVSRGELAAQLQTLKNGICAALLLAAADLVRLNVREPSLTMRPVTELLPAAGQGMLVLLARADDEENRSAAGRLDLMEFRLALAAE